MGLIEELLVGAAVAVGGAIVGGLTTYGVDKLIEYLTADKLKEEVRKRHSFNKIKVEAKRRKREGEVLKVGVYDEDDTKIGYEEIVCKIVSPDIHVGLVLYND